MATVRFTANKDSLLVSPNLGGGDDDHIGAAYVSGVGQVIRGAVDFPLSWTGINKIVSAVLSCKTSGETHYSQANDPDIYVERITNSWSENAGRDPSDTPAGGGLLVAGDGYDNISSTTTHRATWDVGGGANPPANNTWYSVDVTSMIEDVAPSTVLKRDGTPGGGSTFRGFLLRSTTESSSANNVEFWSRDQAGNAPSLLITYDSNAAPSAPTNLSPSGTITQSAPTFSGLFTDPGDTMSKLAIHVSTDSTFASITHWNSSLAQVANSGDTWTRDYTGTTLSVGTTYYWRAAVYDSVGNVSAYSATKSFVVAAGAAAVQSFRAGAPRIEIWTNSGSTKGPTALVALIDDAKFIGVSAYANEVGELYFTLPQNHPQISALTSPLERHYRVSRYDAYTGTYKTVARGIMEDYEHAGDEVVFYGHDYIGFLETTITPNSTTYSGQFLGSIISDQLTSAIAETNSRLAFTSVGTIDTTTLTTTLLTSSEQRLNLIKSVVSIAMATSSVRSVFGISRDWPYQWFFTQNKGSEDLSNLRLQYGGAVNGFLYIPGYRDFATRMRSIGLKVEGASILYSEQTYGSESAVGFMARFRLFQNVINQSALDDLTLRAAREAGVAQKNVRLLLRANQLIPWGGWDLGDNIRVIVSRGAAASLNNLYTIWGMEWTTEPNGRENLYLALASKVTS